ncbi:MAG TPA: SDR family oxidoreductase [Trueperaceae bacterium]|nr:SDR family oxidoreductase [Trueperaceae bacterium]
MTTNYRDLFDLTGKHALVIGAGSGIGRATVHGLADFGASVTCADLDQAAADAVAAEASQRGAAARGVKADVSSEADVKALIGSMDRLDVLVCTPSINVRKPLANVTAEEFDRVVGINLRGSFFALREAGARMAAQGQGSMVFFSSIRSQVVEPGQGVYAATKAGTLQMIRAAAAEWGPHGVRANAVAPGVVETPLTKQIKDQPDWYDAYAQKSALGRWAQPSELVGAVVYLASDASSFVTGSLLIVDGGWTAVDGRFTPPL